MAPSQRSPEENLQIDIDSMKDPAPYKERFSEIEVQELMQALDILGRLREEVSNGSSQIPWLKLSGAARHLDTLLKSRLDSEKSE
jgi:hypothetical protein